MALIYLDLAGWGQELPGLEQAPNGIQVRAIVLGTINKINL